MAGLALGALMAMGVLAGPTARAAPSAGELLREIEHLRVVGRVLYVAAHPDDENTRLLAWLAGARGLEVTYLSLTRGGGGQNLIGAEQAELLGVIRTGELLAARQIDGAGQRFTRARDFGYSKSADEALGTWGHAEVLDDVVRAVRELQPDVIITRFGPDDDTHGHHVASAILAREAFDRAADPGYLTPGLPPWQTDRLVRNIASWRLPADADTSAWLQLDVGGYDPRTGRTWSEVAADSRTMHKSQGFGSAPGFGPQIEHFAPVAGQVPAPGQDLFAGLDLGWSRVPGADAVDQALVRAAARFDPRAPQQALPDLVAARTALDALPGTPALDRHRDAVDAAILACAGLQLQARAGSPSARPGGSIELTVRAIAHNAPAQILQLQATAAAHTSDPSRWGQHAPVGEPMPGGPLDPGQPWTTSLALQLPADAALTQPHWLAGPGTDALYGAPSPAWTLAADTPPSLQVWAEVAIEGRTVRLRAPIEHSRTDPVHGERRRPVEVLPPVSVTPRQQARLVPQGQPAQVALTLRAEAGPTSGTLQLHPPPGGSVSPTSVRFQLGPDTPEQVVVVEVTPGRAGGTLRAEAVVDERSWGQARAAIGYPHLPERTVLRPAEVTIVPVDLDRGPVQRIAYLPGAGDRVAETLRDLGYEVELVDEEAVQAGLPGHDTLVLGVRAFNARPALRERRAALHDWVAQGGRLIVQYNTSSPREPLGPFAPASLTLGRGRVTDQRADMTPIRRDHPVLRGPNRLKPADHKGWVQERGLYFAERWDPVFQPVFRIADPGEPAQEGALLIGRHGDGVFVYTGLAFFRQLPAGVPGAARLFANLLAAEPPP